MTCEQNDEVEGAHYCPKEVVTERILQNTCNRPTFQEKMEKVHGVCWDYKVDYWEGRTSFSDDRIPFKKRMTTMSTPKRLQCNRDDQGTCLPLRTSRWLYWEIIGPPPRWNMRTIRGLRTDNIVPSYRTYMMAISIFDFCSGVRYLQNIVLEVEDHRIITILEPIRLECGNIHLFTQDRINPHKS